MLFLYIIGTGIPHGGVDYNMQRNETLWYRASRAYKEGSETELVNAKSALHILAATFRYTDGERKSEPGQTFLLCHMMMKSADDVGRSAAAGWRGSMLAVWDMVLLSVVGGI
jgi:hypothetical protein